MSQQEEFLDDVAGNDPEGQAAYQTAIEELSSDAPDEVVEEVICMCIEARLGERAMEKALKDIAEKSSTPIGVARRMLKLCAKDMKTRGEKDAADAEMKKQNVKETSSPIKLPAWANCAFERNGRVWFARKSKEDVQWLHTAARIHSGITYQDSSVQGRMARQGLWIEFLDRDGEAQMLPFKHSDAATARGRELLIADLEDAGMTFEDQQAVDTFLWGLRRPVGITYDGLIVDVPGWHGDFFILPNGELIGTKRAVGLRKPLRGIGTKGTRDAWVEAIAPAFEGEVLEKAPQVAACVLWGKVSALIDRAKEEQSYLLSVAGWSTGLKTFPLRVMATAWGSDEPGEGVLVSCLSTNAKREQYAAERSGCGCALDDTSMLATEGETLSDYIYMIATGVEKGRYNQETTRRWRIAVALSSEVPIERLIRSANGKVRPGLMSRVVEIGGSSEDISDAPIETMGAAFENYGHAGPAFIEQMLADGWDRWKIKAEIDRRVATLNGDGAGRQEKRASRAIAYIGLAGDIAKAAGLIPAKFDVDGFCERIWMQARGAADQRGMLLMRLKAKLAAKFHNGEFAVQAGNRHVLGSLGGAIVDNRFGHPEFDDQKKVMGHTADPAFILPTEILSALADAESKEVAKILDRDGILIRHEADRLRWAPGKANVGEVVAYAIYARGILGQDAEDIIELHLKARLGEAQEAPVPMPGVKPIAVAEGATRH